MSKYNSSVYRVRPLMEKIESEHELLNKVVSCKHIHGIPKLGTEFNCRYNGVNNTEIALMPSIEYLHSLIDYAEKNGCKGTDITETETRTDLFGDDIGKRAEWAKKAHKKLDESYNPEVNMRGWYILEGGTCPDFFIEGDDFIIVGEGKWTERHITTTTSLINNGSRNQMIRHIQGALNYRIAKKCPHKKINAFYIVEKGCGYETELTETAFEKQIAKETIPVCAGEAKEILNAFCGYTTWQEIKEKVQGFGDVFSSKEEINAENAQTSASTSPKNSKRS